SETRVFAHLRHPRRLPPPRADARAGEAGTNIARLVRSDMASSILDSSGLSSCPLCGWATLPRSTPCLGCLPIRQWRRVNRAFCELLHRTQSIDRLANHSEIYAPSSFALTA